jgi:hypothetical protein
MNIPNALVYLFPTANPLRDYTIADDGSGPRIIAWNLPQAQPTEAELQAASDAYDAAKAQADAAATTLRTQVVNVAQSAVGVVITNLTAAQVRALLAVLLWKNGALTDAGAVRPLGQWADT